MIQSGQVLTAIIDGEHYNLCVLRVQNSRVNFVLLDNRDKVRSCFDGRFPSEYNDNAVFRGKLQGETSVEQLMKFVSTDHQGAPKVLEELDFLKFVEVHRLCRRVQQGRNTIQSEGAEQENHARHDEYLTILEDGQDVLSLLCEGPEHPLDDEPRTIPLDDDYTGSDTPG